MKTTLLRRLTEGGILMGLSVGLSFIVLFQLPYGGTVTAVSMLPLLVFAVRWGPKWGIGVGIPYGILQFMFKPYATPVVANQFLSFALVLALDYLLAFGVLGLAGFFRRKKFGLIWGVGVGILARFLVHFFSGIILWSPYAGEEGVFLYSLFYNGSYMGIELVITLVVSAIMLKPLKKYLA